VYFGAFLVVLSDFAIKFHFFEWVNMVKIRLSRAGAKKRPFYHIVVADSRFKRDGRRVERVGFFNPIAAGAVPEFSVDKERLQYWLSNGAKPTERVAYLIKRHVSL
jgi:small subunit ribosomal protein S16